MFTKILSKPIFRLSVVMLVNENIFRITPVLGKEINERNYARWSVRKPSKLVPPDDPPSGSFNTEEFYKSDYKVKESSDEEISEEPQTKNPSEKKNSKEFQSKEKNKYPAHFKIKTSAEGYDYQVVDEHDHTFSKLMTQVGNRKMRRKNDLIMLEGKRLNIDALQAGLKPKKIFFTQKSFLGELNLSPGSNLPLFKLPYKTTRLWSHLDTPPGIIGFYGIPKADDIRTKDTIPVKVMCDNVRDPGNMGSIIRVAASVGCTEVLLMKGCTDPWDAKVLRCASGGHFHIPIKMDLVWNEDKDLLLPSDTVFLADSNITREVTYNFNIPQQLYHNADFTKSKSIVVVIGGETEGLSNDAFTLASHYNGARISIPMSNCMESLNSGCALSVILFEIKRQLMLNIKFPTHLHELWDGSSVENEENKSRSSSAG